MFLCILIVKINATSLIGNEYSYLSQEEIKILNELYKLDPNFTYEEELVRVSIVPDSGKDTFNITATATWKNDSVFRIEDGFAIA